MPKKVQLIELQGQTMGTTYQVKVFPFKGWSGKRSELNAKVESVLKEVSRQMSTYIPDSEISKLNQASPGEWVQISSWFYKVLKFSLSLGQLTEGCYDPTLGPLVNLWGFGPLKTQNKPSDQKILEAKKHVGFKKLTLHRGKVKKQHKKVYVDLSSSAKGFGVDVLAELLDQEGFQSYLIEIGGELRARGRKPGGPWRVAIERPSSMQRAVSFVLDLKDTSVATSGSYRNFFQEGKKTYGHTLDFATGRPVQNSLLSVSVFDPSCMKADAYATALMAMGLEKAKAFVDTQGLAAYLIFEDKQTKKHLSYKSKTFKTKFKDLK